MRHQNIVFHDLVKRIPWNEFERLVDVHEADHRIRTLTTKQQFLALLYGQLSGSNSLREVVGGLESHGSKLYHVGGCMVARSTLSDANSLRPAELFGELFSYMIAGAHRNLRKDLSEATYLMDSTMIQLSGKGSEWARFSDQLTATKVHTIIDADTQLPIHFSVTAANVNDITEAKRAPFQPGATYVFDMGYYDFIWWAKLHQAQCRIVTRFKRHTRLNNPVERELPPTNVEPGKAAILSDQVGFLSERLKAHRKNPFRDPVREVTIQLENGKILRLFSNDLNAPAREIADLYKKRWGIELFFRWIKQNLKIRQFIGKSENAIRIQVAVALITYLLLHLALNDQTNIKSLQGFARLVRSNLMHRRPIDRLHEPWKPDPQPTNQLVLVWSNA